MYMCVCVCGVCVCLCVYVCGVCVSVCVCVCVTSFNFEPVDQFSQNVVRPLHNALPVGANSAVGTRTLSSDRQLTYLFRCHSGSACFLCLCCNQNDTKVRFRVKCLLSFYDFKQKRNISLKCSNNT